jgi:hypothetical protein
MAVARLRVMTNGNDNKDVELVLKTQVKFNAAAINI